MVHLSNLYSSMSNPPLICGVRVKWVYFQSKVELAVVWLEAGEDTQLDKTERGEEKRFKAVFLFLEKASYKLRRSYRNGTEKFDFFVKNLYIMLIQMTELTSNYTSLHYQCVLCASQTSFVLIVK